MKVIQTLLSQPMNVKAATGRIFPNDSFGIEPSDNLSSITKAVEVALAAWY
jgi:hypothetical protein